ncbi:MAG: TonB-dependent receptor plug domain-containing protein [bacterium]
MEKKQFFWTAIFSFNTLIATFVLRYFNHFRLNYFLFVFPLLSMILLPIQLLSQADSIDIYDLNFTQLSKIKITTASKVEQTINEIPSTIFIITSREIKERGYFTLEEALSDLTGFQFRNIQGINSYVFQRGIPNQNNLTLILIDGVQVNEINSGGFYAGGQYILSNVERIEVMYGPSSVVYGTNAVNGIINIITKKPESNSLIAKGLIGSFNTSNVDLNLSLTNEEKTLGILFSGMFKTSEKANLAGKEGDYNWTNEMDNFEDDYSFDLKVQAGNFIFGTNFLQKQTSRATSTKSIGTIYSDHGTFWNIRFINNYIKYYKNLSDNIKFSSTLFNRNATVLDNSIYAVVDTAQIGCSRPNNLMGFENIINYKISDIFSANGGVSLEYEQLAKGFSFSFSDSSDIKPPAPTKPEMLNNYLGSIFIEPQLTLFKNLYISAGLRYDNSSVYHQVITPRMGMSYSYDKHVFRLSYSEAFRAPKPWDYTDGLGNPELMPEIMKSLETAISLSILENYRIDIIGYNNYLNNALYKEVSESGYRWINSGEIHTLGFEIYLRYTSQHFKSSLNYTFNDSHNKLNEVVPEISQHSANFSITYQFFKHFTFNFRANYLGERRNTKIIATTNSFDVGPYFIFHSALSLINYYDFDIQLLVKNLFNEEYYHTSNSGPDRYRQAQRTVLLSVAYKIEI